MWSRVVNYTGVVAVVDTAGTLAVDDVHGLTACCGADLELGST
jgi:hypothetical protein